MNMTKFDFKLDYPESKIFTANLIDGEYLVTWMDDDNKLDWADYSKKEVENNIKDFTWIVIEEILTNTDEINQRIIDKLDELQRMISVRKVEHSKIAHDEKISQPRFTDLDWVIEQIHWIKNTL